MLTNGLEQAIQSGKAQERTAVLGAGGVYRIEVPEESFIIIHHFDYWHFIDTPTPSIIGQPAKADFQFTSTPPPGVTPLTWTIPGSLCGVPPVINFDVLDILGTQTAFQTMLNTCFPGFSVSILLVAGTWFVSVTSTSPGGSFNGIVPTIVILAPGFFQTPFDGGTFNIGLIADLIANSVHQLNFRSSKSRNHYLINENFSLFSWQQITGDPTLFFYNVNGYYSKDCYLVHTEDVQVNILKVPPVTQWATTFGALSDKSQENNRPEGYGQGAPGLLTLTNVDFNGLGEFYNPLTPKFSPLPVGQTEFKIDATPPRAIADPTIPNIILNNGKNYPLINVSYVLINKDYNFFVKQS